MGRSINKLTARQVATLKAPGRHADGGGLYLRITFIKSILRNRRRIMTKPGQSRWIAIDEAIEKVKAYSIIDIFAAADVIEDGLSRGRLRARVSKIEVLEGSSEAAPVGLQRNLA